MSWLGSIFGSIPTTADNPQDDSTLAPPPPPPQSSQSPADNTVKVAILLDGDADYFTQAYTSKGYRGGRSASLDLRNKVHHYILSRTSSKSTQIEIIAFSFLNLSGLSNFLGEDLKSFTQGFNSSPYAFSMSDVGNLPQAADEAIKSHLPFLLSTCNHILLGGTHDGGYSQTLLRLDPLVLREKVVLLRTHSFCAERILELGLEEVRFEGLFEGRDPTMRSRNTKPSYSNGSQITSSSSPFKSTQPRSQSPSKPSLPSSSTPSLPKPFPAPSLSDRLAPSPFPISPTPPTSTSSTASPDFAPLLQTLQYFSTSRKDPQPRLVDLGNNLRKRWPRALDQTGGSFGEYVKLAEEKGLIRIGIGRGERQGSDWIELIRAEEKEREKGFPPHLVDSTTTINSKKEPDFVPLVKVLLNSPQPRPLRALIGERLARLPEGERPFEARAGEFRSYYEQAVKEGLVRVGRGDVMGAEWIELGMSEEKSREYIKTHGRASTVSAPSIPSTPTPTITSTLSSASLAPYLPLLEVLLLQPSSRPEWTPIAGFIATYKPRPYSSEPGSFKRYIEGAKSLGLIETGQVRGKEYNFWMELRMGKEEAKELLEREKERGGMRHQSTGFTKVILPPLALSASNSNLASEKVESRFQPLVNALEELRKGGNVRPEWTVIGTVLGNLRPRPYPNEPGALKRYVEEAEKEGLVSTGRVEGKEFGYWMKLNINSQDTKPVSAPSIKPISPPTTTRVPTRFQPLIQAIRDSPFDQPYCSQIAFTLSKLKPRAPFVQGGWRDYLSDAEKEGLVKTGVKGQGQEWVEIKGGVIQTSTSTSAKPESKPSVPTNSSIVVPTSPPSHSSTPSISSVSSLAVSSPMTVTRSSPTIPSALLQHWQSLYSLHPFSPLILTLDFIESSTSTPSPSAETLKIYLGLLPDGLEGVLRRARGDGVLGVGEGFEEYVAKAMKRGVVVVDQDGGRLADEWKGWKGR